MAEATTKKTLEDALLKVQGELKNPKVDKANPHFGNKYVSLSNLLDEVRPVLSKHGLVLSQGTGKEDGEWVLWTRLKNTDVTYENIVPLVPERPGSQGMGSAITYARRQGLCALLGLAGEDDDDGNGAEGKVEPTYTSERFGDYKLTEGQVKMLHAVCEVAEVDEERIKAIKDHYDIEHFSQLTKGAMDEIISRLVTEKKITKDRITGRYVKPKKKLEDQKKPPEKTTETQDIVDAIQGEFNEATFDEAPW